MGLTEIDYASLERPQRSQVDRVRARLSSEPISKLEEFVIAQLSPGKRARWCDQFERRFLRQLFERQPETLTFKQRQCLMRIGWRYRSRLAPHIAEGVRRVLWPTTS